jgi:hypothetical protein
LTIQPLLSDALLELEREEAVVLGRDHPHRNPRPPLELAGLAEHRIGLLPLTRRPGAEYCLRNIVQKVRRKVELWGVPSGPGRGDSRVYGARIAPPGPRGFPWLGDHGIDEYQPPCGVVSADKGGGEPGQRLGNQDDV